MEARRCRRRQLPGRRRLGLRLRGSVRATRADALLRRAAVARGEGGGGPPGRRAGVCGARMPERAAHGERGGAGGERGRLILIWGTWMPAQAVDVCRSGLIARAGEQRKLCVKVPPNLNFKDYRIGCILIIDLCM